MNVEDAAQNALSVLTVDGTFFIKKIEYDEKAFGNIYIQVNSKGKIGLCFTRDRGEFFCYIVRAGQWYDAEDVFGVLNIDIDPPEKHVEFFDYVAAIANLLKENWNELRCAFGIRNAKRTKTKLKALEAQRAIKMNGGFSV